MKLSDYIRVPTEYQVMLRIEYISYKTNLTNYNRQITLKQYLKESCKQRKED